jgi:hypothetical protein
MSVTQGEVAVDAADLAALVAAMVGAIVKALDQIAILEVAMVSEVATVVDEIVVSITTEVRVAEIEAAMGSAVVAVVSDSDVQWVPAARVEDLVPTIRVVREALDNVRLSAVGNVVVISKGLGRQGASGSLPRCGDIPHLFFSLTAIREAR